MNQPLSTRKILKTWWPLAASWILMGAEVPALSAVMARLSNPEINLAAFGGVVYPLALIIEAPIIMLLAASVALSQDAGSYRKLRKFMLWAGGSLTVLHILAAFTPLYDPLVAHLIGAPAEIIAPARLGLMIMTPWTWAIAYRRFNQGVLIRFGRSDAVGVGTVVRLTADAAVLALGYLLHSLPGIAVATAAMIAGVVCEAVYAGLVVRAVVRGPLASAPAPATALTLHHFLSFYIPLALTPLLTLLANPIGSAALSRMPAALASLAVWPVVTGLIFMLRALGTAFNEVVVALLGEPGARPALLRFTAWLSLLSTAILLIFTITPLAGWWFRQVAALPENLAQMARAGMWLALPLPALTVLQSWWQGSILHSRKTRGITESVAIYLLASALALGAGVAWGGMSGLYVGLGALTLSTLVQTAWLGWRARTVQTAKPFVLTSVGELEGRSAPRTPDAPEP